MSISSTQVEARAPRRPGEVLDAVLELLHARLRSAHGRTTSVAFVTSLGAAGRSTGGAAGGQEGGQEGGALSIRLVGSHCQQARHA